MCLGCAQFSCVRSHNVSSGKQLLDKLTHHYYIVFTIVVYSYFLVCICAIVRDALVSLHVSSFELGDVGTCMSLSTLPLNLSLRLLQTSDSPVFNCTTLS